MRYLHEYVRGAGTVKQLTLFHPASGHVRAKGVVSCPNAVLHPWLKAELGAIVTTLPAPTEGVSSADNRRRWERWQQGLTVRITLPENLPSPRMLFILDNLTGHYAAGFVLWLFAHGIMRLYTQLGGSWLNMAESIQRILKRRALDSQHPKTPGESTSWLEDVARGWSRQPIPFVWGGKRQARRQRHANDATPSAAPGPAPRSQFNGAGQYDRKPISNSTDPLALFGAPTATPRTPLTGC